MKIREGFVSNSSSTSFCIYGVLVDNAEEELENMAKELGLFYHYDQFGDDLYIGREWSSIGDNETGKQFQEDVQEKIDKLPIENEKCGTYEESWYNG